MRLTVSLERFASHDPQIHPDAFVHASAVVIGQVSVGAQSSLWPQSVLRGDDGPIVIGRHTSIQDGTVIHMTQGQSTTTVGDRVTVGHRVILHGCTVGDDCIIGMGSILLDNAIIESGCIVGAGAVIPPGKRIAAHSVVVGNPFRVIRTCTERDRASIVMAWRAYVERTQQYRRAGQAG